MDVQSEAKSMANWQKYKLYLRRKRRNYYFSERQVWWLACGFNIGNEENGKGDKFLRPVLILKKFNQNLFWGIPFTSQSKSGKYYQLVTAKNGFSSTLILSQLRLYDSKRLVDRQDIISTMDFANIKTRIAEIIA